VRFGARDYDPKAGRWATKDAVSFGGDDTNLFRYALSDPVNGIDTGGLRTCVIITGEPILSLDGWTVYVGCHAAVWVENGGDPALYDPSGSYDPGHRRSSSGLFFGPDADLDAYKRFHESLGSSVFEFCLDTNSCDEAKIIQQALAIGDQRGAFCAASVSGAIHGIPGFEGVNGFLPAMLYRHLRRIARAQR